MPQISVVIICANAAGTLEAACRSVAWADELVIVHSGSTDGTESIARRFADRYVEQPWLGFGPQRRAGVEVASHQWILLLDADEECSPELAAELRGFSDAECSEVDVWRVPRRHFLWGRRVRSWEPDAPVRFVHRDRVRWIDRAIHDTRAPQRPGAESTLRGRILHRRASTAGFTEFFDGRQTDARLADTVRELRADGRRCRWYDLVLRPPATFVKFYVLRFGFLDGMFGFLVAVKAATAVHLKYSALWAAERGHFTPKASEQGAASR